MENTTIEGVARIGSGGKLHPAYISELSNQLMFRCRCGGTSNGHSAHKAIFFSKEKYPNLTRTCRVGK
jgi:hypothetical protein